MTGRPLEVAVLTTYPPRRCGIATFSRDLHAALAGTAGIAVRVIAIEDPDGGAPAQAWRQLRPGDPRDYARLAGEVNRSTADVVLIQHEYGLFGGPGGELLLTFLRAVRRPVVTVLHTVLTGPVPAVRRVTGEICRRSTRVVVPGPRSVPVLVDGYGVDPARLVQIPHGAPRSPVARPDPAPVPAAPVLMSFGYLGPNKGIEYALGALPAILAQYPGLRYRVVGSQHPGELRRAGDAYRRTLDRLAGGLCVGERVEFVDRYVSDEELTALLGDATMCLFPYVDAEQAVSGTLARAVGAARAVVATPFRHAQEVADRGAAHLVPMRSPTAIARAVTELLRDERYRRRLADRAGAVGEELRWEAVAARYLAVLRGTARR
jgi:glycosyltransferase involved in cell wall biosynthesis